MTDDEARVAELIRNAFRGVTLGEGVGLMQGQGLDDYEDDDVLMEYRAQDEKQDWTAIPVDKLNYCHSSLSFFDAEGMRFHLPAFLLSDLAGTFMTSSVIFHLTYEGDYARQKFSLLSEEQRAAVRAYLMLRLDDPMYEFDHKRIRTALARDWSSPE
jgi:hypothetical protein